jgi:hypothetical protein
MDGALPRPNMMARPYGHLSVQEVDIPLTQQSLATWLIGREAYWETDYLALRRGDDVALHAVVVPWGASLDEVRTGLRILTGVDQTSPQCLSMSTL